MILTVDIGNSNIVLAIFDKDKIIKKWRIITSKVKSKDEYSMIIQQLMKADEIEFSKINGIVLSSVVPEINAIFKDSLKFLNAKIMAIGDKSVKLGLKIKKGLESEIGSDILMNIVAGKKKFKENFIIVDMGTATTFDIALKDAEYAGSIIAPGVQLSALSLHSSCSQLPLIEVKKPDHFMGVNTNEVLKSGIYYGYIGSIKEIVSQIQSNFSDTKFKIYLTGGLSPIFIQDLNFIDGVYPDLTSEGLNEIWHLNNK